MSRMAGSVFMAVALFALPSGEPVFLVFVRTRYKRAAFIIVLPSKRKDRFKFVLIVLFDQNDVGNVKRPHSGPRTGLIHNDTFNEKRRLESPEKKACLSFV